MKNLIRYYEYKGISLLAYCVPLGVLFGVNFEQYIKEPGAGLGFFGYIILMLVILAGKNKFTEMAKKNTVLTVSVVIFIVALIMQYMSEQLLLVSAASLGGCLMSIVPDQVADVYFNASYRIDNGRKIKAPSLPITHKDAWKTAFGFITEVAAHE